MANSQDLAALLRRDLERLQQEVEAFPDDATLWKTLPGVTNSAGNLAMHIEGNIREFIGRQLANIPYTRQREDEFAGSSVARAELAARIRQMRETIPEALAKLSDEALAAQYPEQVLGKPMTSGLFVAHLLGHLNYHMGQMDYLRRILTEGKAVTFAKLQ